MRVAADSDEVASKTVKPFDLERNKSVLGEGACILILESKERAKQRSARVYCEAIAGAQVNEHTNIAFTHEKSGATWAKLIRDNVGNHKIDYINAHGPGDKLVDRIEARAFRQVFHEKLTDIDITSIKSTTGGGNAFASACQIASTAKAIIEMKAPPTTNFEIPDPDLDDVKPISKQPKAKQINTALVSAHGMGGLSAVTLLKRCT